jgi:hypothetical protein
MLTAYHQQTKNLLVSYSPKKLGFFQSYKSVVLRERFPQDNRVRQPLYAFTQ